MCGCVTKTCEKKFGAGCRMRQRWDGCVCLGVYRRAPSRIMSLECKYAREDYHRVAGVAFSPLFLWHRDVVFVSVTADVCAAVFVCLRERPRVWHAGICFLLEKVNYISTGWLDVPCIITHANETCVREGGPLSSTCAFTTRRPIAVQRISLPLVSALKVYYYAKKKFVLAEVATLTGDSWECTDLASMDTPPLGFFSHTRASILLYKHRILHQPKAYSETMLLIHRSGMSKPNGPKQLSYHFFVWPYAYCWILKIHCIAFHNNKQDWIKTFILLQILLIADKYL